MEDNPSLSVLGGKITGITFSLASRKEICKASISDCAISHASQLSNPFLGLPLEVGKCESCGTSEPGQCEGHFGYIELPIPIYHPDHVGELKRMFNLLCLKCLKMKNRKVPVTNVGVIERIFSCCEEASQVAVDEVKTEDGANYLLLKVPSRKKVHDNLWSFLEKYGFRYSNKNRRPLLPSEVMKILKRIPQETRKKLAAKGFFPQEGYVLQYLPVPPNCLSVPDISDGTSIMSRDHSIFLLKRVLKQIDVIKNSRSGMPNFESHLIEVNELQAAISEYFEFRGTGKASRDLERRFGVNKESTSTKAWLEKMKTLFIRKSSGFSSRSVITGDPYIGVNQIGLPLEIAQKITFEERVSQYNICYLQRLVDEKLCLTYRDGVSTYSLREGSKGHTFLRPGQVVHRRIMDGDMVFINRPPTTHKHSLQALSVYIHEDHTVKINPLICGPLSADFDGDCIHLFYPQSLSARAEVLELFSVEKQLLSSHTGNFNLQLAADSLLSLKLMFGKYFFEEATAQQLMMFVPDLLPKPAVIKSYTSGNMWTVLQILQASLPPSFGCSGERYTTHRNELVKFDFIRDLLQSSFTEIVTSILFSKGPKQVVNFFNSLTPLLMENLHSEGFSVCLEDFCVPWACLKNTQESLKSITRLLHDMRLSHSESLHLDINNRLRGLRVPISNLVQNSSAIGVLMDSKSEGALNKVIQQIGFLGMQLSNKGQFYTKTLIGDLEQLFRSKYPSKGRYPFEEFGLVRSCLFHGLDPYQEMIHSISSREVIVRSSRGLTEPGTLFKNLMAILRDVVICYDGTVRNVCANSIIQFEYGTTGFTFNNEFGAGEPVGVLAATAMSNPAYKAVLDSSPSSNSSWEMMKEILLCGVKFKNDVSDRRAILYLKDCDCGRKYCKENAAYVVTDQLKKVSLKDAATELLIEYGVPLSYDSSETDNDLIAHIHLNQDFIRRHDITMNAILSKCEDTIISQRKGKRTAFMFKRVTVQVSECCSFQCSNSGPVPCLTILNGASGIDLVDQRSHELAEVICPSLLETVLKGDPRVSAVNIIWINPDTPTWIRSPCKSQKGELALDVVLEKHAVKQTGDCWRVVMDSCIPVMHLIDINRSIPYAIKQVQELLGISCTFEQAVQRLSTSVMMVTKGVLKDHLVLLANSMTYAGNLVGFNIGGIKALSHSLNVQVPFMEATLSAPRKCFERAAVKQHVDCLSSVVASCAWGKQVAVGTGSAFDLILDTRKVALSEADGIDIYDFLQLVGGGFAGEATSTACLGAEIEHLDIDDEVMDDDLSPVRDSNKPTFEDTLELDDIADEMSMFSNSGENDWKWDLAQTTQLSGGLEPANKGQSGGWEREKKCQSNAVTTMLSDSAWPAWGHSAVDKETSLSDTVKNYSLCSDRRKVKETERSWEQSGSAREKMAESGANSPRAVQGSSNKEAVSDKAQSSKSSDSRWTPSSPAATEVLDQNCSQNDAWGSKKLPDIGKQVESSSAWGKKFDTQGNSPLIVQPNGGWGQKIGGETDEANRGSSGSGWSNWGGRQVKENTFSNKRQRNSPVDDQCSIGEPQSTSNQLHTSDAGALTNSVINPTHGGWEQNIDKGLNVATERSSTDPGWFSWGLGTSKQSTSSAWEKKIDTRRNSPLEAKVSRGWKQAADEVCNVLQTKAADLAWSSWGDGEAGTENESLNHAQGAPSDSHEWGAKESHKMAASSGGQGTSKQLFSSAWEQKIDTKRDSHLTAAKGSGGWKQVADEVHNVDTIATVSDSAWSSRRDGEAKTGDASSKSTRGDSSNSPEWGAKEFHELAGSSWGQGNNKQSSSSGWEKKIKFKRDSPLTIEGSGGWKKGSVEVNSVVTETKAADSAWSSRRDVEAKIEDESSKSARGPSSNSAEWGAKESHKQVGSSWGKSVDSSDGWSKKDKHQVSGWGSSRHGEWKNRSNPANKVTDSSKTSGIFTRTNQRLDLFTVEEQDVLSDVEQIVHNIRRIMHRAGYNDGDSLSSEDQSYISDHVLNHHPDKASKIGAGIQHIVVDRHVNFPETRCFYVVSTDNRKQDFSYRKSLDNYIREKYPDKAEAFLAKYFRRSQRRPGSTQETPPSETGDQSEQ